jgi:hypothetical protein
MAQSDILLGGSGSEILLSPYGRTFKTSDLQIAREDRTASGRLVCDVIATKKQFTLDYAEIDGDDLDRLLDIYDINGELSLIVYTSETEHDDYTVLMKPLDRERILAQGDGLWGRVSVVLDEV